MFPLCSFHSSLAPLRIYSDTLFPAHSTHAHTNTYSRVNWTAKPLLCANQQDTKRSRTRKRGQKPLHSLYPRKKQRNFFTAAPANSHVQLGRFVPLPSGKNVQWQSLRRHAISQTHFRGVSRFNIQVVSCMEEQERFDTREKGKASTVGALGP